MHLTSAYLAVFLMGSIAAPVVAQPLETPAYDQGLQAFAAELNSLRKAHSIPGLSIVVLRDQKIVLSRGYGFSDPDRTVPVTPDTPFWIASVTKSFVGLAFLHLEAEGRIDLDDKAAETPEFDGLCQWLSHSGLPFGRDLHCDAPITIRHILNHQVQGEPGSSFFYNPIMYSRLSRYLEDKFGQGVDAVEGRHNMLAQTIDRVILEPAGMTRTMASQWDRSRPLVYFDMAQGFGVDEEGNWIARARPGRHLAGGAGIVSTVEDLARYDMALDLGLIAPPGIKDRLFAPAKLNDGSASPYGFGWYVQDYRGVRLVWHSGWDEEAGFSALYLKIPDRAMTLILLANGEGLWWDNPLDQAAVERSPFARAFLQRFVFAMDADR
jgi:CubicO group peptidase (beta-lactamase class C family)